MMKKLIQFAFVLTLLFSFSSQVSAQGFLKKVANSVKNIVQSDSDDDDDDEDGGGDEEVNASDTLLIKRADKVNEFHIVKKIVVNQNGKEFLNDDGTPQVRFFLEDQYGNICSADAIETQQKQLRKKVTAIVAKVGGGALLGAAAGLLTTNKKKDKAKNAAIAGAGGAALGALMSVDDITAAKKLKKTLSAQKKTIKKYQETFTAEGLPISANVNLSNFNGEDLTKLEGESMIDSDFRAMIESEAFNNVPNSWEIEA